MCVCVCVCVCVCLCGRRKMLCMILKCAQFSTAAEQKAPLADIAVKLGMGKIASSTGSTAYLWQRVANAVVNNNVTEAMGMRGRKKIDGLSMCERVVVEVLRCLAVRMGA